jgi:hypothetical protein
MRIINTLFFILIVYCVSLSFYNAYENHGRCWGGRAEFIP